jgi:hypothetical protein
MGQIMVGADLQGPTTNRANNGALMLGTNPDDLILIARKGDQLPDAPAGFTIGGFTPFIVHKDSGLAAVGITVGGPTNSANNTAIYVRQPGATTLEKFVRAGDPTPDVAGQNFANSLFTRVNDNGQFLANLSLAGFGISATNDSALYLGTSAGSLTRVAQTGVPVSGLAAGQTLSSFNSTNMSFNNAGKFAGRAAIVGSGTTTSNNDAAFVGSPTQPISILAREGGAAPVPGTSTSTYSGAFSVAVAASGKVFLTSRLSGPINSAEAGVFAGTIASNIATVVLENDVFYGGPAGAKIESFSTGSNPFSSLSTNAHDQAAFLATARYPGNTNTQEVLFVHDPVQGLIPLARTGGTIEIAPGVTRTITGIDVGIGGNGMDGQPSPFNNNGTVVFQATLANGTAGAGTGIFTATVPLVGDVNLDGLVNFTDFLSLESRFGASNAARLEGDLNGDHVVTRADFMLLYNHFGDSVDGPLPVSPGAREALDFFAARLPEPALLAPALGALLLLRRRNRR